MSEPDSHLDWALNAAKLRFGEAVVCRREGDRCCIYLEAPGAPTKLLGAAPDWPGAMVEAVKHNTDLPQPPLPMGPSKAPVGEEFIEEFCQSMRQRDVYSEFLLWYGEKSDRDPSGHPRALNRGEWLEQLGSFIAGLDE